jgi:exopolysaccharide production protein ExoQ
MEMNGLVSGRMTTTKQDVLPESADIRLCALMLSLAIVDFSQVSWWSGGVKPLGDLQRWLTVALQVGYLAANASRLRRAAAHHGALLALTAFCAASAIWSLSPATSLLGATRLLLLALSIAVAQQRHGGEAIARIFLATLAALLVANLLARSAPGTSLMSGTLEGAFRGLTDHKNTLGQFCGLTLAFLLAALPGARDRLQAYGLLGLLAALAITVALTESATAIVLCATAASLFLTVALFQRIRLPLLLGIFAATTVAAVAAAILAGLVDPFGAVGRDTTLTGRAEIWAFVELYVRERPWLGYGYRAFPLSDLLRVDPRWGLDSYIVGSTHNAYLAIVSEIGLVGLAATASWLLIFVAAHFPRHCQAAQRRAAMVLGVYLVSGLSESFAGLSPGLYVAALLIALHRSPAWDPRCAPSHAKARYLTYS